MRRSRALVLLALTGCGAGAHAAPSDVHRADGLTFRVPAGWHVAPRSLTPHLTRPNLTDAVRKAYIVQYGPVGIRTVQGDWGHGSAPSGSTACDDPDRQFPVLRDGRPV